MEDAICKLSREERLHLKNRIAAVMSEILSDKYDCNVTVKFIPKERMSNEHEDSKTA